MFGWSISRPLAFAALVVVIVEQSISVRMFFGLLGRRATDEKTNGRGWREREGRSEWGLFSVHANHTGNHLSLGWVVVVEEATAMVPSRIHGEPRITNKFYHREKRLGPKITYGWRIRWENIVREGIVQIQEIEEQPKATFQTVRKRATMDALASRD